MATFSFYAGDNNNINNLGGSGLGFYGSAGFGASIAVGEYNQNTYITDSNGTNQGPQANNIRWAHANSGYIDTNSSPTHLQSIPNQQATLNIRFTHTSAVQVQNWIAKIYDRTNTGSGAQGVTTKVCQIIHTNTSQDATGSGSSSWTTCYAYPSASISIPLAQSPGISGIYAGNGSTSLRSDTVHDVFLAISASPDSIGSKLFGLYTSLEYLALLISATTALFASII